MTRPGRRSRAGALLLALGTLAGCGVPVDKAPRAADPPPGAFPAPVTGASASADAAPGRFPEVLYLIRDDRVVPVTRRVDVAPSVQDQLDHLLAAPGPRERASGLTSALPGTLTVTGVQLVGQRATVEVGGAGDGAGRSDEVLAFAQLVCTLTKREDIATVAFQRRGRPLGVPRGNGSLTQDPVTISDYSALL
ncbi:GerMN domain-containing protein [Plantactinospora sp. KBS50]|uniref:GerMN domain-containing protein n=1 Tax=Plantactinospora sp. KBS50 TaxID=2024580 RepID=UPI000BAAD633|nr:GerMN domain-containing protein [Plantactinospora sp. KBS50]ASW55330.1 hypothetical protein CIK06_15860 [Plantactinospora sp. KBS50]